MWEILWVGLSGDSERAQDLARTLRRQLEAAGHPQAREIHFAQSFALRWLHGGLDRMRTVVDTELTRRPDDVQMWTFSLWLDAATGHGDRALAHLAERDPADFVAGLAPELRWSLKLVACSVAASAGDPGWAAVLHDALEPYSGRNCVIAYTTFVGAIDHHLGTLALVLGRDDRAVELLGCGLDQHRDLRAEPFVALSARWLARALVQRGRADDRLRAAELQSESLALAERFGLHGLPQFVELDGLGGLDN